MNFDSDMASFLKDHFKAKMRLADRDVEQFVAPFIRRLREYFLAK